VENAKHENLAKENVLSPSWMQVDHKKPGPDPLMPSVILHGVRQEANRVLTVERDQPKRSIFDGGSFR